MRRIIIIIHCGATLVLLSLVVVTSYLSPVSLSWSPDQEVNEKIDKGFAYNDTSLYLVGTPDIVESPQKKGIRFGMDSSRDGLRQLHLLHVDEIGNRRSSVIQQRPSLNESLAYIDEDGDGLPETKVVSKDGQIQHFDLAPPTWTLKRDNQSGDGQ
jgi:hypothetical protein